MSKFVYNVRYVNTTGPNRRKALNKLVHLINYVGTRDGVEIIKPFKNANAKPTLKQNERIEEWLQKYPDSVNLLEYEDYVANPTVASASELLSAIADNNLADNIGSEFSTSEYLDYISHRPGAERSSAGNGLFTSGSSTVNMEKAKQSLLEAKGNVFTTVLSLRREDAARLGYESAASWQRVIKAKLPTIAKNYKIPLSELRWYAAFHNESHHPHCHMILWQDGKDTAFLTDRGIKNIKSAFVRELFREELFEIYEEKKTLQEEVKNIFSASLSSASEELAAQLLTVNNLLSSYSGRLQYAYCPPEIKLQVDNAVKIIAITPEVQEIYNKYIVARTAQLEHYHKKENVSIPLLHENPEFHQLRNIILNFAAKINVDQLGPHFDGTDNVYDFPDGFDESATAENSDQLGPNFEIEDVAVVADDGLKDKSISNINQIIDNLREVKSCNYRYDRDYQTAKKNYYSSDSNSRYSAFTDMAAFAIKGNARALYDVAGLQEIRSIDETLSYDLYAKVLPVFKASIAKTKFPEVIEHTLGKMYYYGQGTDVDYATAVTYFTAAAEKGYPHSEYMLGRMYESGAGVEKSEATAIQYYTAAADNNNYAAYHLGTIYEYGTATTAANEQLARKYYEKALKGLLHEVQTNPNENLFLKLGNMFLTGHTAAIPRNYEQAQHYLLKALEYNPNNGEACLRLGSLYSRRDNIDLNPKIAISYYEKALELGKVAQAHYGLGCLYLYGSPPTLERDVDKAIAHLNVAIDEGFEKAQEVLDNFQEQQKAMATTAALSLISSASQLISSATPTVAASLTQTQSASKSDIREKLKKGEKISNDSTIDFK